MEVTTLTLTLTLTLSLSSPLGLPREQGWPPPLLVGCAGWAGVL
jgi:hypothetical protein